MPEDLRLLGFDPLPYRPAAPTLAPLPAQSVQTAIQIINTLYGSKKPRSCGGAAFHPVPADSVYIVIHSDALYLKYYFPPARMGLRMRIEYPAPLIVPEKLKTCDPLPVFIHLPTKTFIRIPQLNGKPLTLKIHRNRPHRPYITLSCANWSEMAKIADEGNLFPPNVGQQALTLSAARYPSHQIPLPRARENIPADQKTLLNTLRTQMGAAKWEFSSIYPDDTPTFASPIFSNTHAPLPQNTGMFITLRN